MERTIYAVHDRDLENLLKNLNLFEKIQRGEIKCLVCDCVITTENLGFIYPSKGEIKICCDKLDCFYNMMTSRGKGVVEQHEE